MAVAPVVAMAPVVAVAPVWRERRAGCPWQHDVHLGKVLRIGAQRRHRPLDDPIGFVKTAERVGEPRQQNQPALRQHLRRGLGRDVDHALDLPASPPNRRVGEREETLLRIAVAVHQQPQVRCPGGPPGRPYRCQHRTDDVPDLREHQPRRGSQRRRMLAPDQLHVRVVVDHHQFRPPHQGAGTGCAERRQRRRGGCDSSPTPDRAGSPPSPPAGTPGEACPPPRTAHPPTDHIAARGPPPGRALEQGSQPPWLSVT